MQTTEKQINTFSKKLLKDTFLKEINKKSIKIELCASILEGYSFRKRTYQTQQRYAKFCGISVATVKRIENGTCYCAKMISKYTQ